MKKKPVIERDELQALLPKKWEREIRLSFVDHVVGFVEAARAQQPPLTSADRRRALGAWARRIEKAAQALQAVMGWQRGARRECLTAEQLADRKIHRNAVRRVLLDRPLERRLRTLRRELLGPVERRLQGELELLALGELEFLARELREFEDLAREIQREMSKKGPDNEEALVFVELLASLWVLNGAGRLTPKGNFGRFARILGKSFGVTVSWRTVAAAIGTEQ